jgi:pyridoxal phosphate enzyme (YggS family)
MSSALTTQALIERIRPTIPKHVRLIAVSKYVTEKEIREAYASGIRDFGESRIQDAQTKIHALKDLPDITWHLIGHLQSNKVKQALELFDWIHSVDSLKLATKLNRGAEELALTPQICLQVKVKPDPQKFGWDRDELLGDLAALQELQHLQIKGLMSILPQGLSESEILEAFQTTRDLAQTINQQTEFIQLTELSMGMSQDYPLAISAGATMIRLGRILFPALSQ